jgi:NADH-quinone oxidoreductase subunit G
MLGADPEPLQALLDDATAGKLRAVIALGSEASAASGPASTGLLRLTTLVSLAPRRGPLPEAAHVRLPCVSWAETSGTFVNAKGVAQSFERALPPAAETLEVHEILTRLARRLDMSLPFRTSEDVHAAVAPKLPQAAAGGGAA